MNTLRKNLLNKFHKKSKKNFSGAISLLRERAVSAKKTRFFSNNAPQTTTSPVLAKEKAKNNKDQTGEEIRIHQGEVKDSNQIFDIAWSNVENKVGEENMNFPKEIMFLSGAPGAGKGEMGDYIKKVREITTKTIETSQLLQTPEAKAVKEAAGLVASRHVVQFLFEKLLEPQFSSGVVVDGFPRTQVQGECIKHLYDKMIEYQQKFKNTKISEKFNRPMFSIMVLFIEEELSVHRQLLRGQKVVKHNKRVEETGIGTKKDLRKTDVNADLARSRYRQFKEHIYESLKSIKTAFNFHFVLADASPDVVKSRILKELEYQSSNELTSPTFNKVRRLRLATEITRGARQSMISRIEDYSRNHSVLFDRVISVIESDFYSIIKYNAMSGRVLVRSEHPVFNEKYALRMAMDLLSERGFNVSLDVQRIEKPESVDLKTGALRMKKDRLYQFNIEFSKPNIRLSPQLMV